MQARTIPGVEFVHVYNYYETQRVADEIRAAPSGTRFAVYGYSCGANAATVIAYAVRVHTVAGIQMSKWCGGNDLTGNTTYGQMVYGDCAQTFGLGCKQLTAGAGFIGLIRNIYQPDRHGQADNDPDAQRMTLNAIKATATLGTGAWRPVRPERPERPPPEWTPPDYHYGHGGALVRRGVVKTKTGVAMIKRGVQEIVCYHGQC